jgi:hypothetical protein
MYSLFAQVGDPMNVDGILLLLPLLLLVALVLGASTIVSHRQNSWKVSFTQGLGSLLWASPVIAVLAFVGMRVAPQFQFGDNNRPAQDSLPTWLEEGSAKVHDAESFPPKDSSVTVDLETVPEESLPEWITYRTQRLSSTKGDPQGEVWRITLESGIDSKDWKLSEADARASAAAKAAELVQEDFRRFYSGGTKLPAEAIETHAVRSELVAERTFSKDSDPFQGYKVYWQVELSPKVREELSGTWKQEVAVQRAWLLGMVLALLTLISASFAAYFHLDQKSQGAHRFRLKLAATALMTAGALGVLAALPYV